MTAARESKISIGERQKYVFIMDKELPTRIKTMSELYSELRSEENKIIKSRTIAGGTDYMRNRLIIRNKEGIVIDESSIFDTLVALGRLIGFEKIDTADVWVRKGKYGYRLVRRSTNSNCYRSDTSGWMVLSNAPVISVALALNQLFDQLNLRYIATIDNR